jgi:hypothetical protein
VSTVLLLPALLTTLHMGALHPHEKALTLVLAFGPFLLLGVVVVVRRRQDRREDEESGG